MDISQYISVFITEAKENLSRLSDSLLELEKSPSKSTLDEIFRVAHTLKGMAATLGFDNIASLTHKMENLLDELRQGRQEVDQTVVDVLFKCLDLLESLVDSVITGNSQDIDVSNVINDIEKLINTKGKSIEKPLKANIIKGDWEIDWGSKYTEEESALIAKAAKERKNCIEITITLDKNCLMKYARVALVLRELKEIGTIIKTFPSEKELSQEKFEDKFKVAFITDKSNEDIKNIILSISEITNVTFFDLLGETDQIIPSFVEDTAPVEAISSSFTYYEENLIAEARKQGFNIFVLGIYLLPGVLMKAARVTLIIRVLEKFGEIIKTTPPIEDLEEEKFGNYFEVVLVTLESSQKIMDIVLNISEVRDSIKLARITMDENSKVKTEQETSTTLSNDTTTVLNQEIIKEQEELPLIKEVEETINKEIQNYTEEKKEHKEPQFESKSLEPSLDTLKPVEKEISKQESKSSNTPSKSSLKLTQTIRVDIEKLDTLMNLVGELIVNKTHLNQIAFQTHSNMVTQAIDKFTNIIDELQTITMKLRMVPIEQVFSRFPRTIRDLSKMLNKEIEFIVEGEDTELDRTLIDELSEPLMHLIRNAADHGLESKEERIRKNKPPKGMIKLKAWHEGNQVYIIVQDDGKGLNLEKIKNKAIENGIITSDQANKLDSRAIRDLIFRPGFSTSDTVSDISGRGVGLDAVKSKISSLGGSIEVFSIENKGSTFTIKLPLTLAIMQALLIELNKEVFAIPLNYVEEAKNLLPEDIKTIQGKRVAIIRDYTLPLVDVSQILNLSFEGINGKKSYDIVVIKIGDKKVGLIIDNLIGRSDIVVKPLSKIIKKNNYISGASILGDGRISLILNASSLI